MSRKSLLEQLKAVQRFDLVVIGGGATGLGVALDAIERGFSVALLEANDFASGTSSRSTKLLHGGVRYLAQGNVRLVREALHERSTLMAMAPHLAQPLSFVMPAYRFWQMPFYGVGLKLYDLLAGRKGLGPTKLLSKAETLAALPGVASQGLIGGVQYWDGQFDDARFALWLAKRFRDAGGVAINYASVKRIERADVSAHSPFTVHVHDEIDATDFTLEATALVNATGVWVDALRRHATADRQSHLVSPSQGVHLVVSQDFLPAKQALLIPKTSDGRVLFAVPWLGALILGTTDTPRQDLPRHPAPFQEELSFLLQESSKALAKPVRAEDVQSVWVGLRPLVAAHDAHATPTLSREHTIVKDANGMVSVTGGKWTTYRVMAQDTLHACFDAQLLPRRSAPQAGPQTASEAAHSVSGQVSLASPQGLHLYGPEAAQVTRLPGADRWLAPGLTEAMVRYAAQSEWAVHVEDVLARRSRLLFLNAREAMAAAEQVAAVLFQETGIDPQLQDFLSLAQQYQIAPHLA